MEKKNVTEVVIDGTIYKLGGYESSEYLQQVAGYLNRRITEMKALDGYSRLPAAQKALMMELNAADDYFKAKQTAQRLEKELSEKDRELYSVKHELVALQVKQEEADRTIRSLREDHSDDQKRILELETQLRQRKEDGTTEGSRPQGESAGQQPDEKTADAGKADVSAAADVTRKAAGTDVEEPERGPVPEAPGHGAVTEETDPLSNAGDVFRPDLYPKEETQEEVSPKEEASEQTPERSGETFVPDAASEEAMKRSSRENDLASGNYGKKTHRKR